MLAEGATYWATDNVLLVPLAPGTYVMRVDVPQGNLPRGHLAVFTIVP